VILHNPRNLFFVIAHAMQLDIWSDTSELNWREMLWPFFGWASVTNDFDCHFWGSFRKFLATFDHSWQSIQWQFESSLACQSVASPQSLWNCLFRSDSIRQFLFGLATAFLY
jgi:hypothetical protein